VPVGTSVIEIRSGGVASNTIWFASAGATQFSAGPTMTRAAGNATSIAVPVSAGTYKLSIVDAGGNKLGESLAQLRVK